MVTCQGSGRRFGWVEVSFMGLVLLALGLRLWELDGRAMHYDEAIHISYAWRLSNGEQYIHSPWMHGPFQIEFTSLIFRLFGDTDFTARLGYALFGTALVGLPYFLRGYLGRAGAVLTAVMLAVSPTMLYFSRFGREDMPLVFWTAALLVLMWRYIHEGKRRYLYLASAVLALMFATKETAYIVTLIFTAMMFLLALPDLIPWALGRSKLSDLVGPAGFLVLLVTLTLPQWAPAISLFQEVLGLKLATPEGVSNGLVGAPHWVAPFVALPVYGAPWWFHGLAVALLVGGVLGIGFLVVRRHSWKQAMLLVIIPVLLSSVYAALFTHVFNVGALVNGLLPSGIRVDTASGIPVNYVVAGGVLAFTFILSIYLGVSWRGGVWLGCAAIFYGIWLTLYTTFYTNWAGFFSGIWQGMGYWIAQQDVARGGQPWYYYFVSLSVYEFLPLVFGLLGAFYFLKKGDIFGLTLAFWMALTFLAYTVASEKMPWLTVNVALPFTFLAGKYLGELVERVAWRRVLRQGQFTLLVLPPLAITEGIYLLHRYVDPQDSFSGIYWAVLVEAALLAVASAYLVRLARPRVGLPLMGLGVAALLLGFGTVGAFRAVYTYDDSNKEILVYAQGSAHLPQTFRSLDSQVFRGNPPHLNPPPQGGEDRRTVEVDYDLWYPFNWYVRHQQKEVKLRFFCFKDKGEEGWNESCSRVPQSPDSPALLLSANHARKDLDVLDKYQQQGPYRNLLWFPESYRRPGEDRKAEGVKKQLTEDLRFFKEVVARRDSWNAVLEYVIYRKLDRDWFQSEYYSFLPK